MHSYLALTKYSLSGITNYSPQRIGSTINIAISGCFSYFSNPLRSLYFTKYYSNPYLSSLFLFTVNLPFSSVVLEVPYGPKLLYNLKLLVAPIDAMVVPRDPCLHHKTLALLTFTPYV